ncbi:hypothetical protein IU438_28925 [Nocardia cyriacigeorgica]|uniref:hypothetical protein n=1 Tax=Nocardia cyriacigeorgica TaxID=135487 RepID=UPI0018957FCD|nr:hypothetical protein [Nocardia cyriacigeorgica]MBF6399797.1 hypothetical protein [Nocardia cyriacigeorgica]MBF6405374.1 hypothetical protein [Nocardia cyriacigeorgica]
MADLAPLKHGKVVGRFLANIADGPDIGDTPEFAPLSGTVRFTAAPEKILAPSAQPDPATFVQLPQHYVCSLDQFGYISWRNMRGVRLVAPTAEVNPTGWTWRVDFDLSYEGERVPMSPFWFEVPEYVPGPDPENPDEGSSGLVDLALASPVPASNGEAVVRGLSVVDVDLVGTALVFRLDNGEQLDPVTVPQIAAAQDAADAAATSATAADQSADAAAAAVNSFGLSVGNVTTVPTGQPATASVYGGPPAWFLDLGLPQGAVGPPAPDATASVKGLVQLAGDLGGTAAAPTVPGLAGKAAAVHTHPATDIEDSSAIGRSVLTAATQSAARGAIGAGTSSLTLGTTAGTACEGNDVRLSNARTPAANTVPCDFVWVSHSGTRAVGVGDLAAGMVVARAFTVTKVIYQFDTADASGSTTVECRRNGSQVSGSSLAVTAANQADSAATDAARTATFTQAYAVGDRFALAATALGTTPGKGLRAYVFGTWN